MPADSSRAVFLSYASQDAAAARRICEALRSGGVEVWFDVEGGLEHGDEWDAKIRKQIKECVLFIAVISANTQAREEGYFRLEWDLAAERARTIASGVPFILPVVIDDTREPDALVPDRFRMVQWTRLRGGEVPPEVQQRFLKLWSHRTGVLKHSEMEPGRLRPAQRDEGVASPAQAKVGRRVPAAALIAASAAFVLALAAGGFFWLKRPTENAPTSAQNAGAGTRPPTAGKIAVLSPELASVRARIVPDRWTREDFEVLKATLDRLIQANSEEADSWALRSIIASVQVVRGYDFGTRILLAGKSDAERAARIAPGAPLGELALGLHHVAMMLRGGDPHAPRPHIERAMAGLSRDALTRYAENAYYGWSLRIDDANRACHEWLAVEPTAGFPRWVLSWHAFTGRNATEAERWAMEGAKYGDGVTTVRSHFTLFEVNFFLRADLAAARAALERVPPAAALNHRIIYGRWFLALAERKWDDAIRDLARVPDPVLYEKSFHGPKALLTGIAHAKAGRTAPAAAQFAEAERVLRELLAVDADNEQLRAALALTLAYAGRGADARSELAAIEPLLRGRPPYVYSGHVQAQIAETHAVLDDVAGMLPWLRLLFGVPSSVPYTPASFRLDPRFESVAKDPRVEAMVKEFEPRNASKPVTDAAPVDQKSVAVLAFENLSGDKTNEYFSDGISEELLNVLARVPGLKVSARTSAFSFKGKNAPIADIARQLGVAYVVEGSVRRDDARVRITAKLIKAADGFHVWSDGFTRELKDIFAVQDEIAGLIARALQARLDPTPGQPAARVVNPGAYEAYLKGRSALTSDHGADYPDAVRWLQSAIALDPQFAAAHGSLAEAYVVLANVGREPPGKAFPLARAAAERALALDVRSLPALTALGEITFHYEWDFEKSDGYLKQALTVDPNYASALSRLANHLSARNRLEEALPAMRRALELDPLDNSGSLAWILFLMRRYPEAIATAQDEARRHADSASAQGLLGHVLFVAGRKDEGLAILETATAKFPEEIQLQADLGWAYGQMGRAASAREVLRRLSAIATTRYVSPLTLATVASGMGDRETAFAHLKRAFEAQDPHLPNIGIQPYFAPLRDDPRFRAMLRELKLERYFPEGNK